MRCKASCELSTSKVPTCKWHLVGASFRPDIFQIQLQSYEVARIGGLNVDPKEHVLQGHPQKGHSIYRKSQVTEPGCTSQRPRQGWLVAEAPALGTLGWRTDHGLDA